MRYQQVVAASHLDRQVSSESITRGCIISFGPTGVERDHYQRVQHFIWIDRCRARATRVGAPLHLARHLSNQMKGCIRWLCSRSTPAGPNAMRQPLAMLALDTCRCKCNAAPSGDALAQTPVDPNDTLHSLVMQLEMFCDIT